MCAAHMCRRPLSPLLPGRESHLHRASWPCAGPCGARRRQRGRGTPAPERPEARPQPRPQLPVGCPRPVASAGFSPFPSLSVSLPAPAAPRFEARGVTVLKQVCPQLAGAGPRSDSRLGARHCGTASGHSAWLQVSMCCSGCPPREPFETLLHKTTFRTCTPAHRQTHPWRIGL